MTFNKSTFLFLYSCLIFANTDIYVDVSQDTIFVGDKIQVTFIVQNYGLQKIEFPKLNYKREHKDLFLKKDQLLKIKKIYVDDFEFLKI